MDPHRSTRRELALLATTLVAVTRVLEGELVWLVAVLVLATVVLGGLQVLGEGETRRIPAGSVIVPGVAALASVFAIRLVPIGLGLVPAVLVVWILVDRALAVEARLLARPTTPAPEDRNALLAVVLIVAFIAFAGAAGTVPGALVEPTGTTADLTELGLVALVLTDGIIAGLLGYRLALLESANVPDALWSALTYGAVAAIGAAAFRAIALPRLVSPALLTLLLYLWNAYTRAPRRRQDGRTRLIEAAILLVAGVIAVGWNLLLRR
jgi:hypothetical protein